MARGRERGAGRRGGGNKRCAPGVRSGVVAGGSPGWSRSEYGGCGRRGGDAAGEALGAGAGAEPERLPASRRLFLNLKPKCLLKCCTEKFPIIKRILQITRGNKSP